MTMDRNRNKFTRPIRSMAAAPTATVLDGGGSGIYDNVKHKNQRSSGGGGGGNRNGRSLSRSRVGNRNNAKNAQSPKDRLLGRNAKGRQKSCKISTGRRQPPTKDERRSIHPSERTVDDPSDQSDTETKPVSHYDSVKPKSSNTSSNYRTRRELHESVNVQSVFDRMKNFYARRKALCWVLLGFVVLAIVGLIILGIVLGIQKNTTITTTTTTMGGTTVEAPTAISNITGTTSTTSAMIPTITTPEPYRGKVRTISSSCNAELDKIGCVFGSPPSTESCFAGECTELSYTSNHLLSRTATIRINRSAAAEEGDQLCKVGGTLGLCSADGQCKAVPGLRDEKSWYEDAKPEDNCGKDYPPCYSVVTMEDPSANSIQAREDCRNQRSCNDGEANVVWLEHLRCKFGKNRTSVKPCEGRTQRLWMCHRCNRQPTNHIPDHSCSVNGARCRHSNDPEGLREAYCYNRQCYFLHQEVSETNKPMTYNDCLAKKLHDEKEMKGDDQM